MKDIPGCNWIKKSLLDRKISSLQNANSICDYVLACKSEDSISTNTRRNILTTLTTFLKWTSKHYYKTTSVPFSDMTRDTIKLYFDSLQKPDTVDQTHKWKGTYNMKVPGLQKFYRWLYSPNTITASNQTRRPLPDQVSGFRMLKRKEATGYSPSHLWTKEEHKIFLKYCPDIRFKAYHAMSLDTSARPHELLNLKIKDLKERPMAAVKDQMGTF
jgi:site-specific recombinase XerD